MDKFRPIKPYRWARRAAEDESYEVSTFGDKRFSALNARLSDGRTIEEAYQLDVKGYRKFGNDWRLGKGKSPIIPQNDLPKLTSHYFELKNDKFNIFSALIELSNLCSKLICTDSNDKSIRDFVRIVKTEHKDLVNATEYEVDDIVLCLIDNSTRDANPDLFYQSQKALLAAGSVGVLSFVTITTSHGLSYVNPVDQLADLIKPKYREIPGTGFFIDLYSQYRNLWSQWAIENLPVIRDLAIKANGKILTDVYANTDISQARALADILNKLYKLE